MKFLVLALCVCAASAATVAPFSRYQAYQPQQRVKAFAQTSPSFVQAPVAPVNTAYAAAQVVADAPVVAAKAVYNQAEKVYNQAEKVYNQAEKVYKQAYDTGKDAEAVVLRSDSEVNPDGFNYSYETNNNIAAQAFGTIRRVGNEDVLVIQGSYKYVDPEGKEILVQYVADENGFQPQSDILPVGPAIPEAIARSLEYIRAHPPTDKESY